MNTIRAIYRHSLRALLAITSVPVRDLRKKRSLFCTIARAVFIAHLLAVGLSEPDIRHFSGMSQQRVNYLKNARHHHASVLARSLRHDLMAAHKRWMANREKGDEDDEDE